jgi:hypothetical protein
MSLFQRIFGGRSQRSSLLIESPRFGILNLKNDAAASFVAEDSDALVPVLGQPRLSTNSVPKCDVLFIYCDIGPDGRVSKSKQGLAEIVRESEASIVVVATDNTSGAYTAAGKHLARSGANVVLTLNRKGGNFPIFYSRLFTEMQSGESMPSAWVKLAPQIPGFEHPDCPGGFVVLGAGQLKFGPRVV